ncbi:hypothetical protein [Kosakonia sp. 1610]|jgi:hypothetical protein|uniref:hypothetical protein n=1 Tax=Kosakonia sp. 1610 TaxID=3156426 RepID=UPI003D193A91|nr:hypothetical protein [Enterobacter cloacae]
MMGLLLALGILASIIILCFISVARREKILREGRPVTAIIEKIRPVATDDAGNTTIVYTLNVEGRKIQGREKIDTFYAPQMQKGMKIKIMYIDDKNFVFIFDR